MRLSRVGVSTVGISGDSSDSSCVFTAAVEPNDSNLACLGLPLILFLDGTITNEYRIINNGNHSISSTYFLHSHPLITGV